MRGVGAGARRQRDALCLVATELDLAAGCGAGADCRCGEELLGGEIVAVAALVDEGQRDWLSGLQMDRVGREPVAADPDSDDGGRRLGCSAKSN